MLTRFIKIQLVLFTILTIIALVVLGWYYLRIPSLQPFAIGQYELKAELPRSGGLYATANVTYRGTQIGKVISVEPTETGAMATMSIDDRYKIPVDATANVHSVSAIGEQYLDLVSTGNPGQYLESGQTIPRDRSHGAQRGRSGAGRRQRRAGGTAQGEDRRVCSPKPRRRWADWARRCNGWSTRRRTSRWDSRTTCPQVNDIIENSTPILDSQVHSGDAIEQWSRNLNIIAAQSAEQDAALRSALQQAPPTLDQVSAVFSGVRDSLPQTLANLAVVIDMLKRYNKGLEQTLVILPQGAAVAQAGTLFEDLGQLPLGAVDQPAAAVSDRVPACLGVALAGRHQHGAAADGHLLQDSKGLPGQRGSRCAQLSLRRRARVSARRRRGNAAATSRTCRWAPTPGTATRTRSCPARRPARAATRVSIPVAGSSRRRRSTTG